MSFNLWQLLAFVVVLCIVVPVTVAEDEDDGSGGDNSSGYSDVVVLTDSNYDELTTTGSWLLEFYAPWCGHCKKLSPIFDEVATELLGKVSLGKVDCTAQKALSSRFEVKSYPTLKFLRDGEYRAYQGARTKEALLAFGREVSGPPVASVSGPKDIVLTNEFPVAFVYLPNANSAAQTKVFEKVAYKMQGVVRFYTPKAASPSDDTARRQFQVKYEVGSDNIPTVLRLVKDGDAESYSGAWDVAALRKWISDNLLPPVSELGGTNFEPLTTTGKLTVFAVTDPERKVTPEYLEAFLAVAKHEAYKSKFVFANIDGVKYATYVQQFGIEADTMPAIFVLDFPQELYYPPQQTKLQRKAPTEYEDSLHSYLNDVLKGNIQAKGTTAWYNPMRLWRAFEKWINSFSETQLMVGTILCMVVFVLIMGAGCYFGLGFDDFGKGTGGPDQAGVAAAAGTTAVAAAAGNGGAAQPYIGTDDDNSSGGAVRSKNGAETARQRLKAAQAAGKQ